MNTDELDALLREPSVIPDQGFTLKTMAKIPGLQAEHQWQEWAGM